MSKRAWRDYKDGDYGPQSLRDFLKFYIDGPKSGPGNRYECSECGAEYHDWFGVRTCWRYYHGGEGFDAGEFDKEKHAIPIRFDENGVEINGD